MTIRDISYHLERTYGTELSRERISKITDGVLEEVRAWQNRPLEEIYPHHLPGRAGGEGPRRPSGPQAARPHRRRRRPRRRQARARHLGPSQRGREVLGRVCAELANRGVKDVLIVCCDGLTRFPEAIEATWPQTTVAPPSKAGKPPSAH